MAVKDDLIALVKIQEDFFLIKDRYVQALPTPEVIPLEGSISNITELRQPNDESEKISFVPTTKDYQYSINVWSKNKNKQISQGFTVVAKRDLGDSIIESVVYGETPLE